MAVVTAACVEFISRWECNGSPALTSYWDHAQWSIGYGTKSKQGETITKAEAKVRFRDALDYYGDALDKKLTRQLSHDQHTALLSATYNLGINGCDSVIALANEGDFMAAAKLLKTYNHASGEVHDGLTARRREEATLLMGSGLRGLPRTQFHRVYWLMTPDATPDEFMQVADRAFASKATIGFSADDAGIGDLEDKQVVLLYPERQPAGIEHWFAIHYPEVKVVTPEIRNKKTKRVEIPSIASSALSGLHGSADGSFGNPILPEAQDLLKTAQFKAYKSLSNEAPAMDVLRKLGVEFVLVRLFGKVSSPDPEDFIDQVKEDAISHYSEGVQYFEIHNEANLRAEGWGTAWVDGKQFAEWWLKVREALRPAMPDALWGYPGLSPGSPYEDVRADQVQFMEQGLDAVNQADWLGAHCYWTGDGVAPDDMYSTQAGQSYKLLPRHSVPLLITEYSNPSAKVDKATKAKQYCDWLLTLRNIHSAYSFVATASSGFEHETWTPEMASIMQECSG